jgi:hypothetical protein
MTTQNFADMLNTAKKGAGLITAGGVTLQCIAAQHGVSKNGGDPQIIGSYKIVGGQFNGRTMKAWHTLKGDTPASVMGFFEDMAAFGISEQEIIAMGQPNDQAMAALAAKMVNKIVGADVYHQDDNRNPGKKSAWLRGFRVHTGAVPQATANGAAPAPAPAPAPNGTPAYMGQAQAQPAAYAPQQQAPAPAYNPAPSAPQQPVYGQPQVQAPVYQPQQPQAPAPAPVAAPPGYGYPGQAPAAPAPAPAGYPDPAAVPQPPTQPVTPVPGQQAYNEEPPF